MKPWKITLLAVLLPFLAHANGETYSTNMGLVIPAVGITTGPQWAADQNIDLGILDLHDHSPGNGVQITPSGINISSDLSCQSNNLTNIRTTRFSSQSAALSAAADLGALYVVSDDLYYNDGSGNHVRITQGGSVSGSAGTITGLPSGTASAAFGAGSGTFTFEQSTGLGANIDAGTYVLRYPGSYPAPSGNYVAFQAPTTLATGYAFTLPAALPGASGAFLTSSTAGAVSYTNVDNSTLQISSSTIKVKDGGITKPKLSAANYAISTGPASNFTTNSTTYVDVTGMTAAITTSGRPVVFSIITTDIGCRMAAYANSAAQNVVGYINVFRGATNVGGVQIGGGFPSSSVSNLVYIPASVTGFDLVASGTYTYGVQVKTNGSSVNLLIDSCMKLLVYEI